MTIAKSENRAAEEYAARNHRVNEAIAMKIPDRIPFQLFAGYFAGRYCDIPFSSVYYDYAKWRAANIRTIAELEPDVYLIQTANLSGKALEILGPLQMRWPGFNVPLNSSHQMIELEPMKAEEYEAFLSDPSGYMMSAYLPRIFESAAPMAKLPPFRSLVGPWGMPSFLAQFTRPDMAAMLEQIPQSCRATGKVAKPGYQLR